MQEKQPSDARVEAAVAAMNASRWMGCDEWARVGETVVAPFRDGYTSRCAVEIAEKYCGLAAAAEADRPPLDAVAAVLNRHRARDQDDWAPVSSGEDALQARRSGAGTEEAMLIPRIEITGDLGRRWAGRYAAFEADAARVEAVAGLNASRALDAADWRYDASLGSVVSWTAGVQIRLQSLVAVAAQLAPPAAGPRPDAGDVPLDLVARGLNARFHLGRGDWKAAGDRLVSEPADGREARSLAAISARGIVASPQTGDHAAAAILRRRRYRGRDDWHVPSGGGVASYAATGELQGMSTSDIARVAGAYAAYHADPANEEARSAMILRSYAGRCDWAFDPAANRLVADGGRRRVALDAARKIGETLRAGRTPRIVEVGDRREVLPDAPAKLMAGGATDKVAVAGPEAPLVEIARGLNHAMLYGEDDWKVEGDSVVSRRKSIRLSPADALRIFPAACPPPPSREEVDEAVKVLNAAGYGGSSAWRQDYEACRVLAGGSQSFSAAYAVGLASSTALRARAAKASTTTGTIVPGSCKVAPKVSRSGLRAALATILGHHPDGFGASCDRMGLPSSTSIQAARDHAAGLVCDAVLGAHAPEDVGA